MTTIDNIDLSTAQEAFLTYNFHIENADAGPLPYSMTISNTGSVYGAIEARAELASTERGNDAI